MLFLQSRTKGACLDSVFIFCGNFFNTLYIPPLRIGHRVAEHVQKHGAQEVVGELDDLLAFAADGVGFVEDGGDALLFGQGWEGNLEFGQLRNSYIFNIRTRRSTGPILKYWGA